MMRRDQGDQVIVLLHEIGADPVCFDAAFSRPELSEFALFADRFTAATITGMTDEVCRSLTAYEPDRIAAKVILAGHGMGGAVASLAALRLGCRAVNIAGPLQAGDLAAESLIRGELPADMLAAWSQWMASWNINDLRLQAQSLAGYVADGTLAWTWRELARRGAYCCGKDMAARPVTATRFDDAGHFVMLDAPDRFWPWLAGVATEGPSWQPAGSSSPGQSLPTDTPETAKGGTVS